MDAKGLAFFKTEGHPLEELRVAQVVHPGHLYNHLLRIFLMRFRGFSLQSNIFLISKISIFSFENIRGYSS